MLFMLRIEYTNAAVILGEFKSTNWGKILIIHCKHENVTKLV